MSAALFGSIAMAVKYATVTDSPRCAISCEGKTLDGTVTSVGEKEKTEGKRSSNKVQSEQLEKFQNKKEMENSEKKK